MTLLLLACALIEVWGDEPPEPPEGLTVSSSQVEADGTVRFEVDPATTALLFHVRVLDPGRNDWVDADILEGPPELVGIHLTGAFRPELTARWPNNPAQSSVDLGGSWALVLNGPRGKDAVVSVLEWADTDPDAATLHVQVVFTEELHSDAIRDEVQQAVAVWQSLWEPYGLSVAPYYQWSTAPSDCPNALERGSEVYQELSAAGADHDITLVVCGSLKGLPEDAMGVSFGGPPVSSPYAAVALRYRDETGLLGQTMAHEVSHTANLQHAELDELSDTPECSGSEECRDLLGTNNLFGGAVCVPAPDEVQVVDGCWLQDELTPQQVWMLQNWAVATE